MKKSVSKKVPYRQIFEHLRFYAGRFGFRVVLVNLRGTEAYGDVSIPKRYIRIDSRQSWKTKTLTLAHEFFGHVCQYAAAQAILDKLKANGIKKPKLHPSYKNTKYEKYMAYLLTPDGDFEPTKKMLDMIEFCEYDASLRAKNVLQELYLIPASEIEFAELEMKTNPKLRKVMRGFWKKWCCVGD